MAALIALHPDDLRGPTGVLYLLGVGVSTYVAHTLGEAVGARVREGRSLDRAAVRHEIRGALPIATSAGTPAALLLLARADVLDADVVLALALALVDLRLALLGSVVARVSGERSSTRVFLAGFVLAVVAAAVAVLKWQLTH
jgi:nucleotide-binding universal stress UspA family protein